MEHFHPRNSQLSSLNNLTSQANPCLDRLGHPVCPGDSKTCNGGKKTDVYGHCLTRIPLEMPLLTFFTLDTDVDMSGLVSADTDLIPI